ncbi:hypothetical protein, partial [Streptomyces sp. SID13666]|uniref:hypothetical protein n=1 Tax=Streptomyces sp. SID13666 TaxID=2706054 RepID=UPI0019406DCE
MDHSLVSANIVPTLGRGVAVVTGSVDGSVRVHYLEDGRQIAPHIPTTEVTLFHAASARLGDDTVVVTSSWKEANVWSLAPDRRLGKRFGTSWGACLHTMDG